MPEPLEGPLAQTPLPAGTVISLEAVDATTGASVNGVIVSDVVISGVKTRGPDETFIEVGAPLYTPGPNA